MFKCFFVLFCGLRRSCGGDGGFFWIWSLSFNDPQQGLGPCVFSCSLPVKKKKKKEEVGKELSGEVLA
jgi:hypothetical protein